MEVLVQGTISALGFLEDGVYHPEPDCFESVRDLIRFLRNDSQSFLARRICGDNNIVENDLVHLLKLGDEKMFDIVLRLLVNLVQPSMVTLMGKAPEDKEQWQLYWQLEDNLRRAKMSFANVDLMKVFVKKLEHYFIETEWDDRMEEDRLAMERILVLFRYVLSISSSKSDEKRTVLENNSHDRVILAFLESGVERVLLHIASESVERDFHLSVLEIFAYIVKQHKPEDVFYAEGRSEEERKKDNEELRRAIENEVTHANSKKRQLLFSRHSRFAGSYVVRGMAAVDQSNDMVIHKAVKDTSSLNFMDDRKKKRVTAKNRRPFEAGSDSHTSSVELRQGLKKFSSRMLEKGFNRIMKGTKELAFSGRMNVAQRSAGVHYFCVMKYFMCFARIANTSSELVKCCLGKEAFHHVQIQLDNEIEAAQTQRREGKFHGMRAHYALSAYKELILYHQHLLDKGSNEDKEFARATCAHILNMEEYRELGCSILKKFMPGALSKNFLRELVLTMHHYLRMLERSYKRGDLRSVQKRQKKRKQANRKHKDKLDEEHQKVYTCDSFGQNELDQIWARVSVILSDVVMGYEEPSDDQLPLESVLDVTDEDHQKFAMLRIQRALREKRSADAVGLYRAARDVWLIDGVFGDANTSPEEEFCELREIFYANLSEIVPKLLEAEEKAKKRFAGREIDDFLGSADEEDEEEEDEYETKEVSFDFNEYVGKYARNEVLKWYVFLLGEFDKNTVELNKAITKLLHRVAFDLNMPSKLYQLSLFRVFLRINDRMNLLPTAERKSSSFYELYTFGFHLLKKYFNHYEEIGEKMAMEALFWKPPRVSYEIEHGYGSYESKQGEGKSEKVNWTEELEEELQALYNEFRDLEERPADMDVIDFIEHNMTQLRTRRQIQKKMKEFGLDAMGAKANKGPIMGRNFPMIELKSIVDEFKSTEQLGVDMVDWIRKEFEAREKGSFTRAKIFKNLNYLGIAYEGRQPKSSKSRWPVELSTELENLYKDYNEMDPEDKELVSLVDYVQRRLSAKKQRRQIEKELIKLGADIVIEPRQKRNKKQAEESENSEPEQEENAGDSGSETEFERNEPSPNTSNQENVPVVESDDDEIERPLTIDRGRKINALVNSDDELGDMGTRQEDSNTNDETNSKENHDSLNVDGNVTKKRKLVFDSDDEEENVENKDPSSFTPLTPSARKARRVIESDDED